MTVKEICENATSPVFSATGRKVNFNLNAVAENLLEETEFKDAVPSVAALRATLTSRAFDYVLRALVRQALFIQLVNSEITTTWYEVRWTSKLPGDDPRFAPIAECLVILETGAQLVLNALDTATGREVIDGLSEEGRLTDGLPIDYIDSGAKPLHVASNIKWLDEALSFALVKQRLFLADKNQNPEFDVFQAAYKKLRTKTYLTDRVLTGAHKTNREYRWETHPDSVHFALKGACMEIERVLVEQLFRLNGVPAGFRDRLIRDGLLEPSQPVVLCPVTLDPLEWSEFAAEMSEADHGRSLFQVGHLNPLKAVQGDDPNWGHSAANVSWISQNGNRIQGHLSLVEVRELLSRIANNYAEAASHQLAGEAQQLPA